jgi:hypothetical protein
MDDSLLWVVFFIIVIPVLFIILAVLESLRQLYNREQPQNVDK